MTAAVPERRVVVWCPDWPVVAAGGAAGPPLAVVEANVVVACSEPARAEGVQRGLRRRQAEARCPGLVVVAPDQGGEARAFEPVVAAVSEMVPRVEVVRPGVCAFAARGPSRYFGGDRALADLVTSRVDGVVAAAGLAEPPYCRVGVADGHFAAERAARGAVVVPPGRAPAFLAPFPVSTLGDPALADLLGRLGVRSLGDLAALPARGVLARFGRPGAAAHRLARGLDERPLVARHPPPDLAVTAELDPPAERVETAAFVARALAARLHESLSSQGLELVLVRVEAETEHGESRARTWQVEGASPAALAERARWQLDGWLGSSAAPSGPLTVLRFVPEEVRPGGGRQGGFWGGDRAAADRVARVIERVQGRLGPESVTIASLTGGRGPADHFQAVPWTGPPPSPPPPAAVSPPVPWTGSPPPQPPAAAAPPAAAPPAGRLWAGRGAPWPGRVPGPAPATVPSTPLAAEVLDADGAAVGVDGRGVPTGTPHRLVCGGGRPEEVLAWAGPWPVDERWWDPRAHRRRCRWQVVTATGAAHLLALEGGRWTVEATYD